MDQVEFGYLKEATHILRVPVLKNPLQEKNILPFSMICEDPDQINVTHINEGVIHIVKAEKLGEEETRKIFFGFPGMEGEEWRFENQEIPLTVIRGKLHITINKAQQHQIRDGLEVVSKRILEYPHTQDRLIFQTDFDLRFKGLAITAGELVSKALTS